ncbi:ABC transporter permease [Natronospora cellulosivora (SeqCode)]
MGLKNKLKNNENLYYALSNKKVLFGLTLFTIILLLAILGPYFTPYEYDGYESMGYQPPSRDNYFGTTMFGQDVFTMTVYGLRRTIQLGLIAGAIALTLGCLIGFFSGYYSGTIIDEGLMLITNLFLTLPTIPVIIIISAYLQARGLFVIAFLVGITSWPWVARAVRSQTLSIKNQEFVSLSKISGLNTLRILKEDIAANMFSYVFMTCILLFNGTILAAVGLEFLGLGPTTGISLGAVINLAVSWNAVELGFWWWAIIPGLVLTLMVASLYFINTGLDQVFNPRLREM